LLIKSIGLENTATLLQRGANPTGSGKGGSCLVAVVAAFLDLLKRSRSDEDNSDEEERVSLQQAKTPSSSWSQMRRRSRCDPNPHPIIVLVAQPETKRRNTQRNQAMNDEDDLCDAERGKNWHTTRG
jgi:hypothetical protein